VTGVGDTIAAARDEAYRLTREIIVPNARYRMDIGEKLMRKDLRTLEILGWIS